MRAGSATGRAWLPALVAGVAGAVAVGWSRRRFEREIEGRVDDLLAGADGGSPREFDAADLEGLPAPARRYFERVLYEGQPYARTVRLHQRGEFRLGGADAPWRPLAATQYYGIDPPGFVWDATIELLPHLPVRVLDLYGPDGGLLRARLLSAIPVASAGPDPEMNEGELVRYLSEGAWFPTALLPDRGVEWAPVDERTAVATLEHRGTTATVRFHFDERDLVERVTAERYRQEDGARAPWTGYFREYRRRSGRLVPTAAAVEWNLPGGDLQYWRARIRGIEHDLPEGDGQ